MGREVGGMHLRILNTTRQAEQFEHGLWYHIQDSCLDIELFLHLELNRSVELCTIYLYEAVSKHKWTHVYPDWWQHQRLTGYISYVSLRSTDVTID